MKLPRTPRIRFWKPAEGLLPFVTNYHLYAVAPEVPGALVEAVFFPGSATLRFKLSEESRWQARFRDDADWSDLVEATLFGPSDGVTWSRTTAGVALGIGLTPLGMDRFLLGEAGRYANQIVPAAPAMTIDIEGIAARLAQVGADAELAPLLDQALGAAIRPRADDGAIIVRIEAALADEEVRSVTEVAEACDTNLRTLQRLCRRYFGFGPRVLLRRTRFLRSLSAIKGEARGRRAVAIDERYTDYSHFIRDAHHFLGFSPEDFLRRVNPLELEAMLQRKAVIGQPMHGLSQPAAAKTLAD